jgi:hypothetical protein
MIVESTNKGLLFDYVQFEDSQPGTYYYNDITVPRLVEDLMRPGDSATRRPDGLSSFKLRHKRNIHRILPANVWGVKRDEDLRFTLEALKLEVQECGLDWGPSAATVAGRFVRPMVRGSYGNGSVRALAIASLHQGPTYVRKAYCEDAVAIDRTAAYLNSMRCLLPLGPWHEVEECNFE